MSDDLNDCFLYCGKHRREPYLKDEIRQGISSFSDLADKYEIKNGLRELARDIDSGKIRTIMNEYENRKGDYLFLFGNKVAD